jgi:hypothetical protein
MGSSFVEFQGNGFWVRDSALEIWLSLLVEQIDRDPSPSPWLQDLREQWHVATMGFIGCVPTALDEHLATADRTAVTLSLSEQAMRQLEGYGPSISTDELRRLSAAQAGVEWPHDVPTQVFAVVGDHFMRLRRGTLPPATKHARVLP